MDKENKKVAGVDRDYLLERAEEFVKAKPVDREELRYKKNKDHLIAVDNSSNQNIFIETIQKLFTDWRKEYGFFWIFNIVFCLGILMIDIQYGNVSMTNFILLGFVILIFHIFFIGVQYAIENDDKQKLVNHSLSLKEFAKEWDIDEDTVLQLLREGKIDGEISIKTFPLKDVSKEELQELVNKNK